MTTEPTDTVSTAVAPDDDYAQFLKWKAEKAAQAEASKPKDPEHYVHLANGDVHRVKESEFPITVHKDRLGHWWKDGFAHTVIGVYPVEIKSTEPVASEGN